MVPALPVCLGVVEPERGREEEKMSVRSDPYSYVWKGITEQQQLQVSSKMFGKASSVVQGKNSAN